ncbi:DUF2993 domain-containing protein [Streptomyces sp. NPDC052077]|uniref:LmeA family phospholipid-binding protein n=1 Tax=Streptomyces sp. NPDC052077 TaxID=3154757 RepID=UPI0034427A21
MSRKRAPRALLIAVVVLGVLLVVVDRVAAHVAEGVAADRLRASENLSSTPDVSIKGFPFLTQWARGEVDDVEIGIGGYEASTGGGERIRIEGLRARARGVRVAEDGGGATARSATGTATVPYDELLKATGSGPVKVLPGVTAEVVGLADGGHGKVKVSVAITTPVHSSTVSVLSTLTVEDNQVRVHADALPKLVADLVGSRIRDITDFRQTIDELPGGVRLDKVEAAGDGVEITVWGADIRLAG